MVFVTAPLMTLQALKHTIQTKNLGYNLLHTMDVMLCLISLNINQALVHLLMSSKKIRLNILILIIIQSLRLKSIDYSLIRG